VLVLGLAAPPGREVAHLLPPGVPDVSRWEKSSGSAEMDERKALMQYELYLNPGGSAGYEVIRYRIVGWEDGRGGPPYSSSERLQWQASQKDLRRYSCEPAAGGGCRWREVAKDSEEYRREAFVILWILGVHRALVERRASPRTP
jgi:hypothetical protein